MYYTFSFHSLFFLFWWLAVPCYLLSSNAGMHFSSPCTMPNNNHHRIISGFASLLSSVILKMLKIGRMRLFRCGNLVCLFTFILPVIVFCAPTYCSIRIGMLTGRLNTSHNLFIFFLPSVSGVYAELACLSPCVWLLMFSVPPGCDTGGIHHASLFVLHGRAPTNQSPLRLFSNLGAITTLPTRDFNWSGDIKERLWQHFLKVKGHGLWSRDYNADHGGCWVGSMILKAISIPHNDVVCH